MGKVYYNQTDSRWGSHPYTAPGYESATVASSGCGPTCAAMVVSSCKEVVRPDTMCDISKQNGYRVSGGTGADLFPYVANRWGIEYKTVRSSYEAHQACKEGWFVVISCGAGLWTTGGHYILAVGASGDQIEIYDPYLYAGKFNRSGRQGKVNLIGNSAWVQIDTFKASSNARAFYCFKVQGSTPTPQPTGDIQVAWVNTQSLALNVRQGKGGPVVGSLPKGTQVTVYEVSDGWARIDSNNWVSNDYLTYTQPVTNRTMYVTNVSSHLNVRASASTSAGINGTLNNGTEVNVIGESNGWYQINSPINGWVSGSYVTSSKPAQSRNTVGQTKTFAGATKLWSNSNLTGTRYDYKAGTSAVILENTSSTVDKVRIPATNRVAYVSTSAYSGNSSSGQQSTSRNTVGQKKIFKSATTIYSNSNLTGTKYQYKANTSVTILQNVTGSIDKVKVIQTGRQGYVSTSVYK